MPDNLEGNTPNELSFRGIKLDKLSLMKRVEADALDDQIRQIDAVVKGGRKLDPHQAAILERMRKMHQRLEQELTNG